MTRSSTDTAPPLRPMDSSTCLRQAGLRATAPRLKVIQALHELGCGFLGADEIFRHVALSGERIGIGAVYRVLADFQSAGLLERIWDPKRRTRYRLMHPQAPGMVICLVCRQCGKRIPLHDSAIAAPLSRLAIDNGLAIRNEHIEIVVSCHGCEKEVNEV